MNHSHATQLLLQREVAVVQHWLNQFEYGAAGPRTARLGASGQYMVIRNLPLPDAYVPDQIDAVLLVDAFPTIPPIGIYVLNKGNEALVAQISNRMNAFRNKAFHEAPSIAGYTWICYAYANNRWRYNAQNPAQGDNVSKFLASFHAQLNK